jgi:hypothetical protein
MEAIMAMVGTRFKLHIFFNFQSVPSAVTPLRIGFIVKYNIKKSKKLNCHFENFDCRFPKNERDFIIGFVR